ncbi:MAG: NUDIX hydrolase [Sphaerospermopsis sp. SIO1G2]|nr:NUDIX hydrolase [Sphaerospermopsis sp. SIO1G2]
MPDYTTISLEDAETLKVMRFNAQKSQKAAILPFYKAADGTPRFTVYAPVPQHDGEHGRILPYQIARGTIRALYMIDGQEVWLDKGRRKVPDNATHIKDETPQEAAIREAQEELGLPSDGVIALYDCGYLPYENPRGAVYMLHVFLAHIADPAVLDFPDPYACAARLDSLTLEEAKELATIPEEASSFESRPFKPTYLTLLEALHDTIIAHCE